MKRPRAHAHAHTHFGRLYKCKRIIIIILLFPFPPLVCHGWRRPVNHNRATPVFRSRCLLPGVQPATCSSRRTTGALLVFCWWHIQKQKQRGFECCYKVHLASSMAVRASCQLKRRCVFVCVRGMGGGGEGRQTAYNFLFRIFVCKWIKGLFFIITKNITSQSVIL